MKRFCIILGAAKCGTTSLFYYLGQHPEISGCSNKEPNYFSRKCDLGDEWYFGLWNREDLDDKILLESTVNYTNQPSAPDCSENIHEFSQRNNVRIKFIYVMRDPIERLESHYTFNFAHRTNMSLETALDIGNITSTSSYAKQLDPYYEKFDAQDFLLLDFLDLKNNTEQVLQRICEFLKIDSTFRFKNTTKIYNKTEGTPVGRAWEHRKRKYTFIQSIVNIVPERLRQFVFSLVFREKIKGHFKLTERQRLRVYNELKDNMTRLHKTYGIDVSKWGF